MTRYIDAYANELAHFIQHLTAGTAPQPSGRDGLNALLIADAAYLSAQTGQAVRLDNAG
jgi:myo-inositol 2-dehydrogenase/D-chiro-inositol 1-dehydrogenase